VAPAIPACCATEFTDSKDVIDAVMVRRIAWVWVWVSCDPANASP